MFFVLLYAGFLLFAFIILSLVIALFLFIFYLPYVMWRGKQNDKGLYLELSGDLPVSQELKNAFKWWKSVITHKPAF